MLKFDSTNYDTHAQTIFLLLPEKMEKNGLDQIIAYDKIQWNELFSITFNFD